MVRSRKKIEDSSKIFRTNLANFVISQRKQRNWIQAHLASMTGMNQSKLARIETGKIGVDSFPFHAFAVAFDMTTEDVYAAMLGIKQAISLEPTADCTRFLQSVAESGVKVSYADMQLLLKVEGDLRKSGLTATKDMIPGLLTQLRAQA